MKEIDIKKLFEIALDQVVNLEEGLYAFSKLIRENYELRLFFENPLVPAESKKKTVLELFPEALPLFRDLVHLLIDEGMERSVIGLSERFTRMVSEKMNVTFVEVKSPYPLTEQERKRVEGFFGGKVYLRIEIDPSLIAGFQLHASDGRFVDASVSGGLLRLKEEMAYAG